MDSSFDFKNGEWNVLWPGRISRYDLVYLTPPSDPLQGIPVGNGEVGALCWFEESRLIIAVNRCDLWEDFNGAKLANWRVEQEERSCALRHACRLIIDFNHPVFNTFYLNDFKARLSLCDATAFVKLDGAFGQVEIEWMIDYHQGALLLKASADLMDSPGIDIVLERYGSRTFSHWYQLIKRDHCAGLSGTSAQADRHGIYVTHQLSDGFFAAGCQVKAADGVLSRQHTKSRFCVTESLEGSGEIKFELALAATAPCYNGTESAMAEVSRVISQVLGYGAGEKARQAHVAAWKAFWLRSYMDWGDEYLNNLWHLTQYYACSSQRGKYPGRFIHGLWGWNHDVQPWNFYFHWNQQEIYWPLNAAGHHELVLPYLDYRFRSLDEARKDAAETFCAQGAFISDVCDRKGRNSAAEFDNHTPVAQVALEFWRQYQYLPDMSFLKEKVLPFMIEAALFFESLFMKEEDGKFHAKGGTAYEGGIMLRDCITELACARALYAEVLKALQEAGEDHPHVALWKDLLDNMASYIVIDAGDEFIGGKMGQETYKKGLFKGKQALGRDIFVAGYYVKDQCAMKSWKPVKDMPVNSDGRDTDNVGGIFPTAEGSPIFPSGQIGLANKGSDLFRIAVNTLKLYSPDCMGWDPLPVAMAWLGLAEEAEKVLASFPSRWQCYCNGFGHYGPLHVMKSTAALRFKTNLVIDADNPCSARIPFYEWPFRHMGMESMSVLACAMNETLLQSHGGVIRVAPAVSARRSAKFTLHARGGFMVSSEIVDGKPLWIMLINIKGQACQIENPWDEAFVYINSNPVQATAEKIIPIYSCEGDRVMLVPEKAMLGTWHVRTQTFAANDGPRFYGTDGTMLGMPRMF